MSDLLKINVSDHTEKKGGLTYLSWAWAWAEVLKVDPAATWIAHQYGPPGSEQPCMWIGETALVHTSVTINGIRRECLLPVMDNRNNAVKNPDARKVSDAIMRCMTKAIALHGLGLYIYAGEDLPESSDEPVTTAHPPAKLAAEDTPISPEMDSYVRDISMDMVCAFAEGRELDALEIWRKVSDNDIKIHIWAFLSGESKLRALLKANATK
jgi:hypothetical protein